MHLAACQRAGISRHTIALVFVLAAWPTCAAIADPLQSAQPPLPSSGEPSKQQIDAWIAELGDARYVVREQATMRLRAATTSVVDALAEAADGDQLEVAERSLGLLQEFAGSDDPALATNALERLAQLENRPAESALAREALARRRERAAIVRITELGGQVTESPIAAARFQRGWVVTLGPDWKGGNEGLQQVSHLRNVTEVNICGTPIANQGLAHLKGLEGLRKLTVLGTGTTSEAVADLKAQQPGLEVEERRVFLGVKGGFDPNGPAHITEVYANTPARRAGLQPDDVIVRFNGQPVDTFRQLTSEIGKCGIEDEPEIVVRRGGDVITKTVQFR